MSLSAHVSIARRFHRSIRLDTDLARPEALQGFVCQPSAAEALSGMARQISQSSQRAFTWTGPYGGGKSSLALALGALLGPNGGARALAVEALGKQNANRLNSLLQPTRNGWLVVPVVGRRGDPVKDIAASLEVSLSRNGRQSRRRVIKTGRDLVQSLVEEATNRPRDGVLILIDEFGKFLEGAAAEGLDIYFFQELAEAASRSSGRLVIVGILHQAFEQYASRLGRDVRDEWAKIQGRFSDVPLIAGVEEVVGLIGRAIVSTWKHQETRSIAEAVASSIRSRRPGSPADLGHRLDGCWPLHPATAAVLGPMSRRRFGQNERSVFGFLTSAEPGGFQEFLRSNKTAPGILYGPELFWDYLRINLEPAILSSNDSHRWAQGVDAVERCEARGDALHLALAKSIALIDMFKNGSGLAADRPTLGACVSGAPKRAVDAAIADLERWSVTVFRKHTGAWAVYAGSDFDIDEAIQSATAKAEGIDLRRIAALAGLQPVLAKRHYHQTGSLRWFHTDLVHLSELAAHSRSPGDDAGQFLLAVPGNDEDRSRSLAACRTASKTLAERHLVAVGLPRNAFRIRDLGRELIGLEAVRVGRPELDGDSVARREIAARIASVSSDLEEELRAGFTGADWFVDGDKVSFTLGASLSKLASDLADGRYPSAPRIHSELVNRHRPSSNTQAGVRDLMHAMVSASGKPFLGIEGFPIHRGLYSTVLATAGLHRSTKGKVRFAPPSTSEVGRSFAPCWHAAEQILRNANSPVSLKELYDLWERPPYGLRRGVMPILALAFVMSNQEDLAVYCEGRFQATIDDYFVDRLLQDEATVAVRQVAEDRNSEALLEKLSAAVATITGEPCPPEPLNVARRLVHFARELPQWTRRTLSVTSASAEVRRILLHADDPHKALFVELPGVFDHRDAKVVASGIESALRELALAYRVMLDELRDCMMRALGEPSEAPLADIRRRAGVVADLTGDLRLDAFAARLVVFNGSIDEVEALASLAVNKPPRDWSDRDPDQARLALADLALGFRRAEMLARVKGRHPEREAIALVVGTGESGHAVVQEFEIADRDRERISDLSMSLREVLAKSGVDKSVALGALAETSLFTIRLNALD